MLYEMLQCSIDAGTPGDPPPLSTTRVRRRDSAASGRPGRNRSASRGTRSRRRRSQRRSVPCTRGLAYDIPSPAPWPGRPARWSAPTSPTGPGWPRRAASASPDIPRGAGPRHGRGRPPRRGPDRTAPRPEKADHANFPSPQGDDPRRRPRGDAGGDGCGPGPRGGAGPGCRRRDPPRGRVLGGDLLGGRAGGLPGRHHGRHGPARRGGPPRRRPLLDRAPARPDADDLAAPAARLGVARARGPPAPRPRRGARDPARGPGRLSSGRRTGSPDRPRPARGRAGSAREPSSEIIAMNLSKRIGHALLRRRERRRVRAELETYSERELNADLRLSRSDIPDLAAEAGRLAGR